MDKHSWENYRDGFDFYIESPKLIITKEEFKALKRLKSIRIESSYIDTIAFWKDEDNKHISGHRLSQLIQFFSRHIEVPENFIKKYDVKQYHINLIRRMYFGYESYDNPKGATLGWKRPYGNSYIPGDLFEEYEKVNPFKYSDGEERNWIDDNYEFLINIHNETMDIFDKMLNELELKSFEWVAKKISLFRSEWFPTKKGMVLLHRGDKLKRIIEEF